MLENRYQNFHENMQKDRLVIDINIRKLFFKNLDANYDIFMTLNEIKKV